MGMNKSIKIGVVVVGLLAVIALSHTVTNSTLDDLAPKKRTPTPAPPQEDHGKKGSVTLPKPMGRPDAPVVIKVYVTSDNNCDTTTLDNVQDLGKKYGDKLYITFSDLLDQTVLEEAQMAKIGCKSGLTINGKSKFILPERGLKGAILLDGPVGRTNYTMKDVEAIIVHLLEKKGLLHSGAESKQTQVRKTTTTAAHRSQQSESNRK